MSRAAFFFSTERLHIRPWSAADRPALERMAGDPEMMRYVTSGRPWSGDEVGEFLERQQRHVDDHGICFGAVELAATGEVIGLVGMQPHDDGEFELGWWIWKDYWGQGYACEAIAPFVRHSREVMALPRLVAIIDPPNTASKRVAEKLGMRYKRTVSARETIAQREDVPVDYFVLSHCGFSEGFE